MKKLIKFCFPLLMISLGMNSCSSDDKVIDGVFDGTTRGAILRTVEVIENEYPLPSTPSARLAVELEMQDVEYGALFEKIEVYNRFFDQSSGTTTSDVFVKTIDASEFSTGPLGLPRYTLELKQTEMMALHGLNDADIFGGDAFTTELILYLTDGRIFNSDNAGSIITGGFFSSPFQYKTTVICALAADKYVGSYLLEQVSSYVDGPTLSDGSTVTLTVGETSTERVFDTANYPWYCSTLRPFKINFICGDITIENQSSGCACGNGSDWFTNPDVFETYDLLNPDDSVFLITFTDDTQSNCGTPAQTTYRLTKQ